MSAVATRRAPSPGVRPPRTPARSTSAQSWVGINAVNFFLAEVTGVTLPFVSGYLKEHNWEPLPLNLVLAGAGLGVFLAQTPAGVLTDRIRSRRALLAGASLLLGACYGLLPLVPA